MTRRFTPILVSRRGVIAPPAALLATGQRVVTAREATDRNEPSLGDIDVTRFGAVGDGNADDAPAINDAISHLRARLQSVVGFPLSPRLVFPTGIYLLRSSLNLTGLQAINLVVDGNGSVLHGQCADQPVIDALGARWLTIRDLTIIGDPAAVPRVGLQVGRVTDAVADNHRLEDVKILGHFALACLVNVAAETAGFDHVFLWNYHRDPASYCLVQDGLNHFLTTSAFVAARQARDRSDSFNENEFINCDFRHAGGGVPVWVGDTARHRFYRCYAAGTGRAAFVVYTGMNGHIMLDVDCHCEIRPPSSIFVMAGDAAKRVTIRGFTYKDHAPEASEFILARERGVEHVTLENARIEVGPFRLPNCRFIDGPANWTITGTCYASSAERWNADSCFSGTLLLADKAYLSLRPSTSPSDPGDSR